MAIQKGGREDVVFNNLGLAYAGMGMTEKAFQAFKRGGGIALAYNNIGCIYLSQGNYEKAIISFEKAIESSPLYYEKASKNLSNAKSMVADRID
jgi:tetratricopeptide (TPR) repeat protein